MNNIIMSSERLDICNELKKYGFQIIKSQQLPQLLRFEQNHADMQCLRINDTFFVLKECVELRDKLLSIGLNVVKTVKSIGGKYPENILLNAVFIKNKLFCREISIDTSVIEYCNENNIEIINVNQGYTKCSTAVIDDCFITSDIGIFKIMQKNGVEGLLIEPGCIELHGVNYGFIGGCCFTYEKNVFFTGNIKKHKNYSKIKNFCERLNKNIISLTNHNLYDIGGFIVV